MKRREIGPRHDEGYIHCFDVRPACEVDTKNDWYWPFTPTGRIKANYLRLIYSYVPASILAKYDRAEELGGIWDDPIVEEE